MCLDGSMRFDDHLHIVPSSLRMRAGAFEAVAWQTKCERKRRGTRFIIADVSLSGCAWLAEGYKLLDQLALEAYKQGDSFLCVCD